MSGEVPRQNLIMAARRLLPGGSAHSVGLKSAAHDLRYLACTACELTALGVGDVQAARARTPPKFGGAVAAATCIWNRLCSFG